MTLYEMSVYVGANIRGSERKKEAGSKFWIETSGLFESYCISLRADTVLEHNPGLFLISIPTRLHIGLENSGRIKS
jgi:hypothetical protein